MRTKLTVGIFLALSVFVGMSPFIALAQSETPNGNTTDPAGTTLQNPLKVSSLPDLIDLILKAIVQIGFYVLILMIVYSGFLFIAARGREEEIRNARSALTWTVIGGLILLGAEAISAVIQSTATSLGT
jgi:heme/copper-type cytochrome/quinol oxidase subunit 2